MHFEYHYTCGASFRGNAPESEASRLLAILRSQHTDPECHECDRETAERARRRNERRREAEQRRENRW
jgi:hypothetical protein